jgi:RND family efflux transporter MFP subunit
MHSLKILLSLLLLAAVSGCSDSSAISPQKGKHTTSPVLVEVATATEQSISKKWVRSGTLIYRRFLRVYTQEEGRITNLPWFEGDKVSKGDILIALDNGLLKKELKKAKATESMAARRVERLERLQKTKAASEEDLVEAQTALQLARVEVEILNTRIAYTIVKAPFSGIVTHRLAEPGDVVSQKTHVLTIAAPESLVARISASPQLLNSVNANSNIKVHFDTPDSPDLTGKLKRIFPTLNQQSRMGTIEIGLSDIPHYAKAGQFIRATIAGIGKSRLLIPATALRTDRKGEYVYLVNESSKVERKTVTSGIRIEGKIEILNGLKPGNQVVKRGFINLQNREFVTVLNKD